jgi:hypothetical protein
MAESQQKKILYVHFADSEGTILTPNDVAESIPRRYYDEDAIQVGSLLLDFSNDRVFVIDREPFQSTSQIETEILIYMLRYVNSLYRNRLSDITKIKQPFVSKNVRIISDENEEGGNDVYDDDDGNNSSSSSSSSSDGDNNNIEKSPIFSQATFPIYQETFIREAIKSRERSNSGSRSADELNTVIYLPRIDPDVFTEATIQRDLYESIPNLIIISI